MRNAPRITDHLSHASQREWQQLQQMLEQLGVSYVCDPTLVRGLDYYNKTVFEFVSNELGAQSTFCGGGRYDYLSQALGEKDAIPALGAAIGLERLELILDQHREQYPVNIADPLHIVVPLSENQQTLAMICADIMRTHHLRTDVLLD